jgi:cobalt-zinc-cadmium efflux system outer membrane protein
MLASLGIALLVVVGQTKTAAPASAPEVGTLSLDDALRIGEQRSPLVRRARAATGVVAAGTVGASLIVPANPFAALLIGRREESSGGVRRHGLEYVAHLEQTIEVAGQRQARLAVVEKARDVAGLREKLALSQGRARIRAAYIGSLIGKVRAEAARGQEELVNRVRDAVGHRVRSGAASEIDLRLADAEAGRLGRQRLAAELAATESLAVLAAELGLPPEAQPVLSTKLGEPEVRLPPLRELLRAADSHRADLRALGAADAQLDSELVLLRREAVPNPTLMLEVERDLPGQLFVGGGVSLPLPFWRRRQGERAVVHAERQRLAEERALTSREAALEVERAYRRVIAGHDQAAILERTVVPATNATVDLLTEGWKAGKFDLFRVLQATRDAADARRLELDVLEAFWRAVIDLDRATGAI